MNELNELELNKEAENIKAKIIFEQEKIGALKPLIYRLRRFFGRKQAGHFDLFLFLFMWINIALIIWSVIATVKKYPSNLNIFTTTIIVVAVLLFISFCFSVRKIPLDALNDKSLECIKNVPFLADAFRKSLNKDGTIKLRFNFIVSRYISNINNNIRKLNKDLKKINGEIDKEQEFCKFKRLYNIAKDI